MSGSETNSAASRMLARRGESITLRNYPKTGEDDHGENYDLDNPNTFTLEAIADPPMTPETIRDAFGVDVEAAREIYIESGTTAANNVRSGGGAGASEVDVDDATWVVVQTNTQPNGLMKLMTTRGA